METYHPNGRGCDPLLLAACVACFCPLMTGSSLAQTSPATLPNVHVSANGRVSAIAVQNDGKVIVGGEFVSVNGVGRTNIARLSPDGVVDEAWNPEIDFAPNPFEPFGAYYVSALALAGTDLFVAQAASFEIGSQSSAKLLKVSTSGRGEVDAAWHPITGDVRALVASNNFLYAGGGPFLVSSQTNSASLARVSITGTGAVDQVLAIGGTSIFALALSGTDLYVGGIFQMIGGVSRKGLARLSTASGAIDLIWNPDSNPFFSGFGLVTALAADGNSVYVGGHFSQTGYLLTNLAKVNALGNGAIDMAWAPNPGGGGGGVDSLLLSGGKLYVAGSFMNISGQSLTNLARVSASGIGTADVSWTPNPDGFSVLALAVNGSTIYAGGSFTQIKGVTSLAIARLGLINGVRDDSFRAHVELPGDIKALARQPDGKVVFSGRFDVVGGFGRKNLARLNADGTVDAAWNPRPNGSISALAVGGNDVFIGGEFSQVGAIARTNLAKLSATGGDAPDPLWNPSPDGPVNPSSSGGKPDHFF